ncbi:AAA family ATPase [Vibrio makurazakiensis]|uniref:AAA family ATPase n=1 Tax=Vibrio makurazakiensis TaxID=2910250 RepID=UPI003D0F21BE
MMHTNNVAILIAASEQLETFSLTHTLNDLGVSNITLTSVNEEDIIRQSLKNNISTIFLDVMNLDTTSAQRLIQSIVTRTNSKVFAIGQSENIGTFREMLSAGASDYLVNPIEFAMLEQLSFVSETSIADDRSGKVISIVSAKGGSGSSTIAATLSQLLATQNQSVTSVDLDFSMGDLDLLLNVEGNTALVEMLQFPERLEPVLFERSGVEVSEKHTLFTGYLSLESTPFWPEKTALELFNKFCLQNTDYVTLDIPTYSLRDQVGQHALRSADVRIIVLEPTLGAIRNANQILKQLQGDSYFHNIVVLNHTKSDSASMISAKDVENALGVPVDVEISFAPSHFVAKSSLGQPVHIGHKRVKAAFQTLMNKVTGQAPQRSRRQFWKRGA